jgi:hypothetical protein
MKKIEYRWALMRRAEPTSCLFACLRCRFCFRGETEDSPITKTFRTREQAREVKKDLLSYGRDKLVRVVKVRVTYEVMG